MAGEWIGAKLTCPRCRNDIQFRYAPLNLEYLRGHAWVKIIKGASIIFCPVCGGSVDVTSLQKKAGR